MTTCPFVAVTVHLGEEVHFGNKRWKVHGQQELRQELTEFETRFVKFWTRVVVNFGEV